MSTPRDLIDSVLRSVCGHEAEVLQRFTSGGLNEAYRAELPEGEPVVVRIARRPEAWFLHEEALMTQARRVGVPAPEVVGIEQVEHGGELLSFSVQQLLPGRALGELASELPPAELERLVLDGGELLAKLHALEADRGAPHSLEPPEPPCLARAARVAHESSGPAAAAAVERGAQLLQAAASGRAAPRLGLSHGDWLPKHLLIDGAGSIVGVIDWEFAGPAPAALDLAHWEVAAGDGFHELAGSLRRGYARVADPEDAGAGWVSPFAIHFALDVLGWRNPASPERIRHCVELISRHVDAMR